MAAKPAQSRSNAVSSPVAGLLSSAAAVVVVVATVVAAVVVGAVVVAVVGTEPSKRPSAVITLSLLKSSSYLYTVSVPLTEIVTRSFCST